MMVNKEDVLFGGNAKIPLMRSVIVMLVLMLTGLSDVSALDRKSKPVQPLLKTGGSLPDYMKKYPARYKRPMDDISEWSEGKNIEVLLYTREYDARFPVILSSGGTPFGVLQEKGSKADFLFDTDGDGKLDHRSETPLVPIWLVVRNSTVHDRNDRTADKFMQLLYDTFQSNSGPDDGARVKQALSLLKPYYAESNRPNRDLMYLLYYYIKFTDMPEQAIRAMKFMEKRYTERYGRIHPVILLHLLESNINAGRLDEARSYSEKLLKLSGEFVPALFYQWQLQAKPLPDDDLARALKKSHPDHWLVKKIGS